MHGKQREFCHCSWPAMICLIEWRTAMARTLKSMAYTMAPNAGWEPGNSVRSMRKGWWTTQMPISFWRSCPKVYSWKWIYLWKKITPACLRSGFQWLQCLCTGVWMQMTASIFADVDSLWCQTSARLSIRPLDKLWRAAFQTWAMSSTTRRSMQQCEGISDYRLAHCTAV